MTNMMISHRVIHVFALALFLQISAANAQVAHEFQVHFKTNISALDTQEKNRIDSVINSLSNKKAAYKVNLRGHTDADGSLAFNQGLSSRRATNVASYFRSKGFRVENMQRSYAAFNEPVSTNKTETGKAKNRRVDIEMVIDLPVVAQIGEVKREIESHKIKSDQPQKIVSKSGSVINIPEDAFVDENGNPVKGDVTIAYNEYRDPVDFILSDLPMSFHNGHEYLPFTSAGMFKITATREGKQLQLRKGKKISVDYTFSDDPKNYGFYSYDTVSGQWSQIAQSAISNNAQTSVSTVTNWSRPTMYYTETPDQHMCDDFDGCLRAYFVVSNGSALLENDAKRKSWAKKIDDLKKEDSRLTVLFDNRTSTNQRINQIDSALAVPLEKIKVKFLKKRSGYYKFKLVSDGKGKGTDFYKDLVFEYKASPKSRLKLDQEFGKVSLRKGKTVHYWSKGSATKTFNISLYPQTKYKTYSRPVTLRNVTIKDNKGKKLVMKTKGPNELRELNDDHKAYRKKLEKNHNSLNDERLKLNTILSSIRKSEDSLRKLDLTLDSMMCFYTLMKSKSKDENETELGFLHWFDYFHKKPGTMKERIDQIRYDYNKYSTCVENIDLNIAKYRTRQELRKQRFIAQMKNRRRMDSLRALQQKYTEKVQTQLATMKISGSMAISKMGIFNADQTKRLVQPLIVHAEYVDEEGNKKEPLFVYLIDNKLNGAIRYDGYMGYSPYKFPFSSKSKNCLVVFDEKANAYLVNREEMASISVGKPPEFKHTFTLKSLGGVKSKSELKGLISQR